MPTSQQGYQVVLFLFPVSKASWYLFTAILLFALPPVTSTSETVLEYRVNEELQEGEYVGDVARDYGFDQELPVSTLSLLRFSFLTLPTAGDRMYFSIDEQTGVIRTAAPIDREEVCPERTSSPADGDELCTIKFDVAVRPIEHFRIIKVRIEIIDINDNAPLFIPNLLSIDISEAAETGTSFVLPAAEDADSQKFAVSHYELVPSSGPFELNVRSRADGSFHLRLILRASLDRETTESYQLTVVAVDGGEPPYTGLLTVNVIVRDANDNSPIFTGNGSYSVSIDEDVPSGTVITRVSAADADLGDNSRVRYDLSVETMRDFGDVFGVEPDTGELYTRAPLDYEKRSDYALYVTASDCGGNDVTDIHSSNTLGQSLSNQALVVVRLNDINDNAPHIRVHALATSTISSQGGSSSLDTNVPGGSWQLAVPETVSLGAFVAHVTVDDADSGENGRFHCTVLDSSSFALRPLPPHVTEFKLVTVASLDREQRSRHRFSITCRDNGRESLSSTVPVEIHVIDVNDHDPEFAHTAYHVTVAENNAIGASLLLVAASDRDTGLNGDVRYRIDSSKPEVARLVRVDAVTGLVSAMTSFDREVMSAIEFDVIAVDGGSPPRSGRTRVHLIISDLDDQLPVFSLPAYTFFVVENLPAGAEVGFVAALDKDTELFNQFTFSGLRYRNSSVIDAVSEFVPFVVDPLTGRITTLEPLDREMRAVYELAVITRSRSSSKSQHIHSGAHNNDVTSAIVTSSSCDVTIRVVDVNDNRPRFRFPTSGNDRVVVYTGQVQRGQTIGQVRAIDDDVGLNGQIEYRMLQSDVTDHRRGIFVVDRKTGDVRIDSDAKSVDVETIHQLTVVASDNGTPTLSEHATLHVAFVTGPGEQTGSRKSAWPRSASDDGDDNVFSQDNVYGILASGDLAVVLAVALGAVLVAIAIIVALVCLATTRRRHLRHNTPPSKSNGRTFPFKSDSESGVKNMAETMVSKSAVLLTELTPSQTCKMNGTQNVTSCMTSLDGCERLKVITDEPLNELELTASPAKGGTRPVVAFIKGLVEVENSPPNSYDSNSDSGRGPSSDDGDTRRHRHSHCSQHLQQKQQQQQSAGGCCSTLPTASITRRLATGISSNSSSNNIPEQSHTYMCMPRPDVTSLPIDGSVDFKVRDSGSGETGARSTRRGVSPAHSIQSEPTHQASTSRSPSHRKSKKIDLTPDVISWYSTTSNIPPLDAVRRLNQSNDDNVDHIELAQSSNKCRTTADNWLNSLRYQHRRYPPGTSGTLGRHTVTPSSNIRGGTHHVTWYQSATIGRKHSVTAVDHLDHHIHHSHHSHHDHHLDHLNHHNHHSHHSHHDHHLDHLNHHIHHSHHSHHDHHLDHLNHHIHHSHHSHHDHHLDHLNHHIHHSHHSHHDHHLDHLDHHIHHSHHSHHDHHLDHLDHHIHHSHHSHHDHHLDHLDHQPESLRKQMKITRSTLSLDD